MLSIRAKLTLWYLGIAAAVLIAFAVAIYLYLSNGLLTAIDDSLRNQAARIARAVAHPLEIEEMNQSGALMLAPQFVSIVDKNGEVSDQILDREGHQVPVIQSSLERAASQWEPQFDEVSVLPDKAARVITWPARDEEGDLFFVVVGQSLKELHQAQRQLLLLLAISNPIALLLASLGGLWIANKALSPVDRLTRAAEHIGRGNLSERVEETGTNDEIGRLAATFNEMIGKLEQAFQRERRFTADASHELKTPLAILRGDIEVALRRDRTPEEYRRVLASSLEEIARLTKLTDDLLTLARSDAGEVLLEMEPVRIDRLAREVCESLAPLAASAGITLDYRLPDSPALIEADASRIRQLVVNLLDNAIKYTPSGGNVRLDLKTEGEAAVLEVADTGRGILDEALPRIFDRFYRQSDPSDLRAGGFGLGLAISKWIVEAHHGVVEVESKPGLGSRFIVRLPQARIQKPEARSQK
ncbi:MAG TPA: ATP-binding protein [Blastocatellia bacterium]|nr:ATP-binding protein [Blastocatellia bacterium]